MEEKFVIPKAKDLVFSKAKDFDKEQNCNMCDKKLKSILSSPRSTSFIIDDQGNNFIFYTCSEKCSIEFKNHRKSDAYIIDQIEKIKDVIDKQVKN